MEPISSALQKNAETTIHTAGGAYIGGNVVAETFIGRDQYNYYFIGLAPLVHDPTRRFRNFLNEYLGTPGHPVPFGGRQAQLEELHRWLNDADAPPYYLMTAEAGRGKSALVCRWMEEVRQQRPAVEVIFIPISIRFETAAQDTVFAALAARLAKFYDDPLKPAALSGAQWQGVCESYLDHTPPAGKQLLIILDGLDEATGWQFGAGFFSTDPPLGLRVVVTARLRVGESTPQGWAATLGWHERLTKMVTLPPLTRTGIEEALTSMGDPLAGFADQVTSIEQLYRLTEGDPLLVRLYVQEFEKHKATVGTLDSAALQQMTPGLQGYFDQWWKGQKAQWRAQGNDPEKEEAHLRLLLDALAAALGPVTLDDLAQLHPDLGSSRLIRAQLQSVERWVIGDGKAQGYSYSHARMGYYFWEQLSDKEQAAWDERFCAWGATTRAALNAEQLDPKAAPVYLLRHYGQHLERSHAPAEAFYALISNGWRKAWEWLDVSYGGFLTDVDRAWKQAEGTYNLAKLGRLEAIIQQIKAAFCRSSIATLGSNIPPDLLSLAVKYSLYTPIQALIIVKLMIDQTQRSQALAELAPYLPQQLIQEALDIAYAFKNLETRLVVLSKLIPYLPDQERNKVLQEILRDAYTIADHACRVDIFTRLIPYLPELQRLEVTEEALTSTQSIVDASICGYTLSMLAPHLPITLLPEALMYAKSIKRAFGRSYALSALALRLTNKHEILFEAIVSARELKYGAEHATALIRLLPYLLESPHDKILKEILRSVQAIQDQPTYNSIMLELAQQLSEKQRKEVLTRVLPAIEAIEDLPLKAANLSKIALLVPENLQTKIITDVLACMRMTNDKSSYASVLNKLAPKMPEEQSRQAIAEALSMGRKITYIPWPFDTLVKIAPYLSKEFLAEVLGSAQTIEDEEHRAWALGKLAPHLPAHLLADAVVAAQKCF